jgi:hypothetical protein
MDDDDLQWVRTLMVPMHLGLLDKPFVPHNLISAPDSPVPLPKLQMTPTLKILMSSGSKKGTQIYFPFLSKSPGKRFPYRFPNGAPIESDTRLQGIFTHLLIYLFISKALRKERPFCPPKAGPLWKQTPIPEPYLTYLSGSPVKEPSPEAFHTEPLHKERRSIPRAPLMMD